VYRIGGAQAIAALAYGTETIRPVDVIVGPGNRYVALAKREVAGVVGIDSFAGPSEVVVVADGSVPAAFAAADLLAQAEHGPGGSAVLVTWDADVADATDTAIDELLTDSARRADITATLATGGRIVLVDDALAALDAVNEIAPEHLELLTADPHALVPLVRNAGAVFVGPWAPAALGDYVAGVNHVLPTDRTARFASALRVDTFRKHVHVVDATEAGLTALAPHLRALAAAEGLDAHARSVDVRSALTVPREQQ
jgi:histidinol dehydrogenase